MKHFKKGFALLLAALLALPSLGLAESLYDAGKMTQVVAKDAAGYGYQINGELDFVAQPEGGASRRARALFSLMQKLKIQLSYYDDYGTGRVGLGLSLDGVDVLEATVLLPADGSLQATTSLTGDTVLTLPAGSVGQGMNLRDAFYGSIVRRRTDVSLTDMTPWERLRATSSDVLILVFNHLLGWTSYTQMEREGELYVFDETFFEATETRDPVDQRMIGTVYATEFCELLWNIAATTDAQMGDFQQALADCLAEMGVRGVQVQQLADRLMPQETIDPAQDYVTPTHAVDPEALCTIKNVSYFFKKLVKYTDRLWEECNDEKLSLIVSYDNQGRMVGLDAVLPKFTESLVYQGDFSWSLKHDDDGNATRTMRGDLRLDETHRLHGEMTALLGVDVQDVCDNALSFALTLEDDQAGESHGIAIQGASKAVVGKADDGADTETRSGTAALARRDNGQDTVLLNLALDGLTTTPDGLAFISNAQLRASVPEQGGVAAELRAKTGDPDEAVPFAGPALDLSQADKAQLQSLSAGIRDAAKGLAPRFILHPGVLSDLTALIAD